MAHTIVRYTVKAGMEEENAARVRAVYEELAQLQPEGFRYATYRVDEGRTFIHVAELEDGHENPLRQVAAFAEFQAGIDERCESGPVVASADLVGRFDGRDR